MNIHEYQAKVLLKNYGFNVLNGFLVTDLNDLEKQARRIETDVAVIKAQIHAGGRGKAGGVKLVSTMEEAIESGKRMLGQTLVTHQTGPSGQVVRKLYLEEGCHIVKEFYLSMTVDRLNQCIALIASHRGGMDIEQVAADYPEDVYHVKLSPFIGIKPYHVKQLIHAFQLNASHSVAIEQILKGAFNCFIEKDLEMLEINPLVLDANRQFIALDAKMSFDDNALYKHPDIQLLKDDDETDATENVASAYGLNYVSLDGEIGCLVNGAGLAMATMDAIAIAGGTPANFLDVGGSASDNMVEKGFEILLSSPHVKGIFVNIFGGIMHCDTIALGVIKAAKRLNCHVPIVVRLEGTNVLKGKFLIEQSGLNIIFADNMDDGAQRIVKAVKGGRA